MQSDPIGLAGGLNTYGYVTASPVLRADPLGLQAVVIGGAAPPPPATGATGPSNPGPYIEEEWLDNAINALNNINSQLNVIGEVIKNVCNPPKADAEPTDYCEQLALAEAKAGAGSPIMSDLADEPRLTAHYGSGPWIKMRHTHVCFDGRKLVIHYFTNGRGLNVELKFKSK